EISRVLPSGITFFPTGDGTFGSGPFAPLRGVRNVDGCTWVTFDPGARGPGDEELYADGSSGFIAHADRGYVFVKTFADAPASARAPGEAEVEIYLHRDRDPSASYMEIEVQGPYGSLEPDQGFTWMTKWYLRRTPPGAHDAELLQYVKSLVRGSGS